jgi:AbrB family looped-hinge helix DNA binding protein
MLTAKISSKGQIVIPKEVRERLKIDPGTCFRVRIEKDEIILTPLKATPLERLYHRYAGEGILEELEKEHANEISAENRA